MKNRYRIGHCRLLLALPLLTLMLLSCSWKQPIFVSHSDAKLTYLGRVKQNTGATIIYWPGTSVQMNFEGTEVKALMTDETGANYFNVIIDNTSIIKFKPDTIRQLYTLVSQLKPGRHSIQLFKLTEGTMGSTQFYGFQVTDGNAKILTPAPPHKRKIEFYGNSITSGYSVEDITGDSGEGRYFNNYLSYAAITARHYDADYHCISKSGIGLMVSWFPVIMPEMYDRLDPEDPYSKWNFNKYKSDVVVINLLQNDSWLVNMPTHAQFKARFGTTPPDENYITNAYKTFIQSIREKYPDAAIICALGSMDAIREGSPWPGYIEKAVSSLHDARIYTHFFPYTSAKGHPKVKEHQAMAESLIRFIDAHVRW
jgi:hypothetical protein